MRHRQTARRKRVKVQRRRGRRTEKIDVAKEAQEAHKKICEKAMDTMDSVKSILLKVNLYLDKAKK